MQYVSGSTTPNGQLAIAAGEAYTRAVDAVRNNDRLAEQVKREQMARLYLDHAANLADLHEKDTTAHTTRLTALRAAVFGIADLTLPGDAVGAAISYRDAQDRASALATERAAIELMDRATRTGDVLLARAVAAHAFESSWQEPLNAYAVAYPQYLDKLDELIEVSRSNPGRSLGSDWTFMAVRPPELGHLQDYKIRALAEGAPV